MKRLEEPIRTMLNGERAESEHEVEAVTRRGHRVTCRVRLLPLNTETGELRGVIVLMAVGGQTMMLPARDVSDPGRPA